MEYFDLNKNIDMENLTDLEIIHDIYTSSHTKYKKIDISHKKFHEFYHQFLKFKNRLGDQYKDSYWVDFMRTLSRYRFRCAVSPLPFSHESNMNGLYDHLELKEQIRDCEDVFPEFRSHANNLLELYKDLSQSKDNPFNDKLEEVLNDFYQKNCALVLKSQSSYEYISKIFEGNKYLSILKESEYRKSKKSYDLVLFLGHHSWYEHYLFTSVKSKNLIGICYDFIGGKKIEPLDFSHPLWDRNITSIKHEQERINLDNYINDSPEEISNEIEIEYIQKNMDKKFGGTSEEQLNARLTNLAGGYIAFLRNHEGIDTTQDVLIFSSEIAFKSKEVSAIEPGDYVLLRTGADRDLILLEANKLMGKNANAYRILQDEWKKRLIEYDKHNPNAISRLRQKGIELSSAKYRGWMRENAIKPKDNNEFKLLLEEIFEKEKNISRYVDVMSEINAKHIAAGSRVRKKILNMIHDSDLSYLEQKGFQEFKLPDTNASISVYRVLKISNQDKLQWRSQTDTPILASEIMDD